MSRKPDNTSGFDRLQDLTNSIGSRLRHSGETAEVVTESSPSVSELPLDQIRVDGVNVRTYFDDDALAQLADSMRRHGLLQPVVVAPEPDLPDSWRLIAGERRLRAAQQLGWTRISVRILPVAPAQWKALMMAENTLREDFTLGEELEGYALLRDELGSVDAVAQTLGLSASYIYSLLRIWRHPKAREAIVDGTIVSKAVARILAGLVDNAGQERTPGLMDHTLAFVAKTHPSKAQLKAYVDALLHQVSGAEAADVPKRVKPQQYSFLTQEEHRVNKVVTEVLPALSPVELRELRQMYQALLMRIDTEVSG